MSGDDSKVESNDDALQYIQKLKNYVIQRNEVIDSLREELRKVKTERDELKHQVTVLTKEREDKTLAISIPDLSDSTDNIVESNNSTLDSIDSTGCDSGVCMSNRTVASHGETTTYDLVDEKRDEQVDAASETVIIQKKTVTHRSSARRHIRSNSASLLELSVDLRDKSIECLENRYGGKEKANNAARKIQSCYRRWVLSKSFLRMRASSNRKRSLTMPEKHFEQLKKTSLVFYGPENPLMIIDGEAVPTSSVKIRHKSESDINDVTPATIEELVNEGIATQSIGELVKDQNLPLGSESTDDSDSSSNEKEEDEVEGEEEDIVKAGLIDDHYAHSGVQEKDVTDFVPQDKQTNDKRSPSRTSSEGSSQYDIIDDTNVLTVEGKHVDLVDGSSFPVDHIHTHEDYTDGLCFSTEKRYETALDNAMRKRQFRIGVNLFNWKPEVGIQYLIDNNLLETDEVKIADFLRKQTTISKQKISEYFGNLRNEFNNKVLLEFASTFDFVGKDVDEALRQFQSYFKLTGEAQTVEKFLQVFSERYVQCNPGKVSDNPDTILLMAFALAMLNTDLHNENVKRRMTVEEFLKNLRGTDDGNDLDQEMLRAMYYRIQKNEFATGADHMTQLYQIENSFVGKVPNLAATHRQFVKLFTVEEVYDPSKREKPHNRLAFLFNDLLLLAKPRGKAGAHGSSGHMFSCKSSYSLLGKRVAEFSNENYPHGVLLLTKIDNKAVATFNLKDEKTRKSLVDELDEYIRETNGIENIRIALTKAKQLTWHNRRKDDGRTLSLHIAEDDHRSHMERAETTSLMDLRVDSTSDELKDASGKLIGSSSMGNIREASDDSEEESNYEKMIRTSSSASLDSRLLTSSKQNGSNVQSQGHQQSNQLSTTLPARPNTVKKSHSHNVFGGWVPKIKKTQSVSNKDHSTHQKKREKSPSPSFMRRQKSPSYTDNSKTGHSLTKDEKRKSLKISLP